MTAAEKESEVLERNPVDAQSRQVASRDTMPTNTHSELTTIMQVVERVAMNPEADMDKLEKLLDMQERVLDRNAKQQYTADLAEMQTDLPRVIEHGRGHNDAKFAKLEDINDAIRPTLHKYGFAVTFRVKQESSMIWITTVLSHKGGHSEETSIPLASDTSGGKNAVQAVGSAISYGKRYGLCAMLNISTGDDTDGNIPGNDEAQGFITDAQLKEIEKALEENGVDPADFLVQARVNTYSQIQAARFPAALNWIKRQGVKS